MIWPWRNEKKSHTIMAVLVIGAAAAAFFALGGANFAQSSIYPYQYGETASISIVRATVDVNRVVTLHVKILGWKMYPTLVGREPNEPGGGHWVIIVDGRFNKACTKYTLCKTKILRIGNHKIYAELAENDGSYLEPPAKSRIIRVTISRRRGASFVESAFPTYREPSRLKGLPAGYQSAHSEK